VKGETQVVKDLSFSVYNGEFLSIIGPSGCGKTTVLSLIAGLMEPSGGQILLKNEEVKGYSELVAYMLQRDHLFEWRTIEENIVLGLQVRKKCTRQTRQKAVELLKKYGLGDFSKYYPQQLSGGMRQKVALIRTLAVDPELLLLDEPFSSLDYQTRLALSDEISEIIRTENKTAVLVTHDIAEAISMSDRVLVLSARPTAVKTQLKIEFDDMSAPPIQKRKDEKFRGYFDFLWKELAVHVE
jgi:NitT/TauT family transport system ATP-binding protein